MTTGSLSESDPAYRPQSPGYSPSDGIMSIEPFHGVSAGSAEVAGPLSSLGDNAELRRPDQDMPEWIGDHQIVSRLSVGASSDVFLAVTRGPMGFARPVVIKRLRRDHAMDPVCVQSLAREAAAYARLNHASIVRLYEFTERQGHCALVLEYVNGMSLAELLARLHARDATLGDAPALYVMGHVFAALAAAHSARNPTTGEFASVIHRDISPKNVLIDWDGMVKLTDFGIAKLAGIPSDTANGVLKGTFGYMAPEQVLGEPSTVRTDVYCGCLLLRDLLLGRRTFVPGRMPELELLQAMAAPQITPIEDLRPGVAPDICRVLRIGLDVHPDRRVIGASEIRESLAKAVDAENARFELTRLMQGLRATQSLPYVEESVTTVSEPRDLPLPWVRETPPARHPSEPASGAPADGASTQPVMRQTVASAAPSVPGRGIARPALAFAGVLLGVILLLEVSHWRGRPAVVVHKTPPAEAVTPPPSALVLAPTSASPTGAPPEQASPRPATQAGAAPSVVGALVTRTQSRGNRIYVDGRVVGTTGVVIQVRCGWHRARYGSKGRWQGINVPCGGEYTLEPSW